MNKAQGSFLHCLICIRCDWSWYTPTDSAPCAAKVWIRLRVMNPYYYNRYYFQSPHIRYSLLRQDVTRWRVAWPAPSQYLNQCWNILNWTLRNKLRWNFNSNSYIFIQENVSELSPGKLPPFCLGLNMIISIGLLFSIRTSQINSYCCSLSCCQICSYNICIFHDFSSHVLSHQYHTCSESQLETE